MYCVCSRPYPDPDCPPELEGDEMIQCIICEDWFHGTCLNVGKTILESEDTGELICNQEHNGSTFVHVMGILIFYSA